jgi:hypothetical protein
VSIELRFVEPSLQQARDPASGRDATAEMIDCLTDRYLQNVNEPPRFIAANIRK